jgi:hypothetical protein
MYGREPNEASFIYNWMIDFVYERHGHLLQTLDHFWLQQQNIADFAEALKQSGSTLPRCWGFLDGNLHLS